MIANVASYWTPQKVKAAMAIAARTLNRITPPRPNWLSGSLLRKSVRVPVDAMWAGKARTRSAMWAQLSDTERADLHAQSRVTATPTPGAISAMEETLGWHRFVKDRRHWVALSHLAKRERGAEPPTLNGEPIQASRQTLHNWANKAAEQIASALNRA